MCNVQGTWWKEIIWKEMKDNICSSNIHYQSGEADNYTDYIVRSKVDRYPGFSNKEKKGKPLRLGNLEDSRSYTIAKGSGNAGREAGRMFWTHLR